MVSMVLKCMKGKDRFSMKITCFFSCKTLALKKDSL